MLSLLSYGFMQRAIIVSIFIAISMPLVGIVVVNKNISVIGDALAHSSLVGVVLGLILGVSPVITAIIICILASVFIELLRKAFPGHSSLATIIVLSFSIGLASILTDSLDFSANLESYLFGSIVSINENELYMVVGACILVIFFSIYYYRELQYISFDEIGARIYGINVDFINFIFTILTAIIVGVAAKSIGVMIVSSILVIPVACSLLLDLSYFKTIVVSSILGFIFMLGGLVISYYFGLKPGGVTVILATATLVLILLVKKLGKM